MTQQLSRRAHADPLCFHPANQRQHPLVTWSSYMRCERTPHSGPAVVEEPGRSFLCVLKLFSSCTLMGNFLRITPPGSCMWVRGEVTEMSVTLVFFSGLPVFGTQRPRGCTNRKHNSPLSAPLLASPLLPGGLLPQLGELRDLFNSTSAVGLAARPCKPLRAPGEEG